MMKKIFTTTAALLLCIGAFAQGIDFRHIGLKEALEKSAAENKPVFLDCYTSWCGPCKMMAEQVFVLKEAGDYFNPRFVSIKIDMEKGEGPEIAKKYGIKAYPTFLVINADGTVRHTVVGGGQIKDFIARVEAGMDETRTLPVLEEEYKNGTIAKKELLRYRTLLMAQGSEDYKLLNDITEKLYGMLSKKEKLSSDYWGLLRSVANTPDTEAMKFILANRKALNKKQGADNVDAVIYNSFEQALFTLASGRRTPNADLLSGIRTQLDGINLNKKETLYALANIAEARAANDFETYIDAFENNRADLSEMHKANLISSVIMMAEKNANKSDYLRLADLLENISGDWTMRQSQKFFSNAAPGFRRMSQVGVVWEDFDKFEDVIEQARLENKPIFLDCYTTWCGPCQHMANNVFPQEEVGDFFNRNFINIKMDMEKGEGPEIGKRFGVRAYPTFIMLTPDGEMRHIVVGGGKGPEFIEKVKPAFDNNKALGALQAKFDAGERDRKFLENYMEALKNAYSPKAAEVAQVIFESLDDEQRVSQDNWNLFSTDNAPAGSEIEKYLLANIARFKESVGSKPVEERVLFPYTQKIYYVISGRDRKSTAEDMDKVIKEVGSLGFDLTPVVTAQANLAKLMMKGDVNVKNYRKVAAKIAPEDNPFIVIYYGLKTKFTPAQLEQWKAWGNEIANTTTNPEYKQALEQVLAQ